MKIVWLSIALAGCAPSSSTGGDIAGPFTGTPHRYVVDRIDLPTTSEQARSFGDDMTGDGRPDNQLGQVIATFNGFGDLTMHAADILAAGAIASSIEIQADDLGNDPAVGVTYLGADGDASSPVGGAFENGMFHSNRTLTTQVRGIASVRLPVFQHADPSILAVDWMEIDLSPDSGDGYYGVVRGLTDPDRARQVTANGFMQMIAEDPPDYPNAIQLFDTNIDGRIDASEVVNNSLVVNLFGTDVTRDGVMLLSIGFGVHLAPCDSGTCTTAVPADRCSDRVLDGDETDIDCGGSCPHCAGGLACAAPGDCQSNICSNNTCAPPSCTDGVLDGFETALDCGWNCSPCQGGQACRRDADCASGHCTGTLSGNVCQ